MKVDLKLHPHRPVFSQELKDMDLNCRRDECARMIQTLTQLQNVERPL